MQTLSTPAVKVNGDLIYIKPNTFMYDGGEGEWATRSVSIGGGQTDVVHSRNAETMFSIVKFEMEVLQDTDTKIAEWKDSSENEIEATQQNGDGTSTTLVFPSCVVTNRVERNATSDGGASLEWAGAQMYRQ